MRLVIDRIEERCVICENEKREMIELSIDLFPMEICEGDIIDKTGDTITILKEGKAALEKELVLRMNKLFEKDR
jgi:hypothetical protein